MMARMRANQKRHYLHRRSTHKFQVGDLVLHKKHQKDKMELKWEPNYRAIKLPSSRSAIVESNITGKTKRCNVGDLKHKHPPEDWELKPDPIGRAARFVNHPDSLPDIDNKPDDPQPHTNNKIKDAKYSLRRAIKTPQKLDL